MNRKLGYIIIIIFCFVLVLGCSSGQDKDSQEQGGQISNQTIAPETSVWAAYWAMEGSEEELKSVGKVDAISVFGIYYDADSGFIIPDLIQNNKLFQGKRYLSFINDQIKADGSSSLKDPELLYSLLETQAKREEHVKAVLKLVKMYGYEGIEIDYENIGKDKTLWNHFTDFLALLSDKADKEGISVRVVLEPLIEFGSIDFPKELQYVIMCYNLHGNFSDPGAKADIEFVHQVVESSISLPIRAFAFATGGFDWRDDGSFKEVTQKEAMEFCDTYGIKPAREEKSQALSFHFKDLETGITHTIWFADDITIQAWRNAASEKGDFGFALWRLGGNNPASIQRIFSSKGEQ